MHCCPALLPLRRSAGQPGRTGTHPVDDPFEDDDYPRQPVAGEHHSGIAGNLGPSVDARRLFTPVKVMSSIIEKNRQRITKDNKTFFEALDQRIAKLSKEQSIKQGQLAEYLIIFLQYMDSFEKGIRKVPASMLSMLTQLFGISVDKLVGLKNPAAKRGPMPKLQR